jgi:hypothetical protein
MALEIIEDDSGSVTIGWVGDAVLYCRYTGALTAELGARHAQRLQALIGAVESVRYFADASRLQQYDLLARSAFVRLVLANRRKFKSIVLLTWSAGISPVTEGVSQAMGGGTEILTDASAFEAKLLAAAPLAKLKLDPKDRGHPRRSPVPGR